jgi:mannose-6-phosphate isomerase
MVRKIDKPWGYELHFAVTDRYVGKVLFIKAGETLSLQYHNRKDESVFVQSGRLLLTIDDENGNLVEKVLEPGEAARVTPGTRHRFAASVDTTLFEVSTTEIDDVVRLEDRYGRTSSHS